MISAGLAAAASVSLVLSVVWVGQIRPLFSWAATGLTVFPGVQAPWVGGVRGEPMGPVLLSASVMIDEDDLLWPNPWGTSAYVRDVTGTEIRRVPVADRGSNQPGRMVVSPDGRYVVVGSLARVGAVRVIDTSSGAERDVDLGAEGANTVPLDWSRDGSRFYAYSTVEVPRPGSGLGVGGLVTVEAATGTVRKVADLTGVTQVAPSPSGHQLFLAGSGNARIVDASTGGLLRVVSRERSVVFDAQPWSPEGRWIIGKRSNDPGFTIVRFDAASGSPQAPREILDVAGATGVAWASSDAYLIAQRRTTPAGEQGMYVSALDVRTGALRDVATWLAGSAPLIVTDISIARDLAPRYFAAAPS